MPSTHGHDHLPPPAPRLHSRRRRRRRHRRRRADRRAVDDQHRHGRHRGHGAPVAPTSPAPAPRSCASRSTATRPPRPCRTSATGWRRWARPCRWSATSTTTATRCSAENPACAEALDKYRINPGNVGFKAKRDRQFSAIVELALKHAKPVRIGVNWGSLDQELLTRLMDENAASPTPKDARAVMHEAIVQSALLSAERAEELGMRPEQHHHLGQGQRRAGPRQRLHHAGRRAAATPCTWGSPKPAWAPRASSPPPPPWASCCSRASATPSASR